MSTGILPHNLSAISYSQKNPTRWPSLPSGTQSQGSLPRHYVGC